MGSALLARRLLEKQPVGDAVVGRAVDRVGAGEDAGLLLGELGPLQVALPRRRVLVDQTA